MALNFYRYKTFVVFNIVTFENFQILASKLTFTENFPKISFESDKNCVTFKSVTFEKFLIIMENIIGIIPNTFHDFQKENQK